MTNNHPSNVQLGWLCHNLHDVVGWAPGAAFIPEMNAIQRPTSSRPLCRRSPRPIQRMKKLTATFQGSLCGVWPWRAVGCQRLSQGKGKRQATTDNTPPGGHTASGNLSFLFLFPFRLHGRQGFVIQTMEKKGKERKETSPNSDEERLEEEDERSAAPTKGARAAVVFFLLLLLRCRSTTTPRAPNFTSFSTRAPARPTGKSTLETVPGESR